MDVVLVPLRLELRARLIVRICFWKCFKKTLINILLWQYSTPAIRGEIFNINDAEPDKSPPAFSVYEGSVSRSDLQVLRTRMLEKYFFQSVRYNRNSYVYIW